MTIYKSVDKDLYTGILMLYQFGYSQLEISKLSGIDKKIVDRICLEFEAECNRA